VRDADAGKSVGYRSRLAVAIAIRAANGAKDGNSPGNGGAAGKLDPGEPDEGGQRPSDQSRSVCGAGSTSRLYLGLDARRILRFSCRAASLPTLIELIRDIFDRAQVEHRPVLSFEFFPTRTEAGERALLEQTIPALSELKPDFCSVTYGAGGSTREKTLRIADRIQREHQITAMAHLTCVDATIEQTRDILEQAVALGIRNILALRGDGPGGDCTFVAARDGFEYSYQLVRYIRQFDAFSIGVAGFPEGHIACQEGKHLDWQRLQAKIEHGADFVITQLFFQNSHYYECREFLAKRGVTVPIVPGILPILSTAQIKRFVALCGAALPGALVRELERRGDDDQAVTEFGIEYATRQCEELLREGAPGLHFYTLNKARSASEVVRNLAVSV
jgi:methylenetetrahydrofolate reductase (NADPH)